MYISSSPQTNAIHNFYEKIMNWQDDGEQRNAIPFLFAHI